MTRPSVATPIFDNNSNTTLKSLAIVAALAGSADAFTSTLSSATHWTSSSCATTGNNVGLTKELGERFVGVNANIDDITISEEMGGCCLHGTIAWRTFDEEYLSDDDMDTTKAQRKAEKKRKKAARRAQREGTGNPAIGRPPCTLCGKSVDLLVWCTHTASGEWVSCEHNVSVECNKESLPCGRTPTWMMLYAKIIDNIPSPCINVTGNGMWQMLDGCERRSRRW